MRPEKPPFLQPGDRFQRLTVIRRLVLPKRHRWECRCDCGAIVTPSKTDLVSGNTGSCGCLHRERASIGAKKNRRHGHKCEGAETPEYRAWHQMRSRCRNAKHKSWARYGGRGLLVCERWETFENFLADMGLRPGPGYSLGRIDNDRGYEPGNVEWQTMRQQSNNRCQNVRIEWRGRSQTVAEWAREMGVWRSTLRRRMRLGWPVDRIMLTPVDHRKGNHGHD